MILVVEDSRFDLNILAHSLHRRFPALQFSFVVDGQDAFKALTGEAYLEVNPSTYEPHEREPLSFDAVLWDNQFPASWGKKAEADMGLQTIAALKSSDKVSQLVLGRLFSVSGDPREKLVESGYFQEVFGKPFSGGSINTLECYFASWGLGADPIEKIEVKEDEGHADTTVTEEEEFDHEAAFRDLCDSLEGGPSDPRRDKSASM